jgi:hypothetical protein
MTVRCTGMKLLSEVFQFVNIKKKQKTKTNEQLRKPCQLVSDLDVVGGLYTNKRPSRPSFANQIYHS